MASKLLSDARYFEETVKVGNLKKLLDGRSHTGVAGTAERLQAMKWLLAMISKGHDVSQFYPDVVKNVVVKSVELKKLVYIYLLHYTDHNPECRELALLSINSFQKDMSDSNPLIRALALRTMTSIRVHDMVELQLMAIKASSGDSSAYVRKTAAHAIPKLFSLDPNQQESLVEIVQKLLQDASPMVIGSAMSAFQEVCPGRYDVLDPVFQRLCKILADVDEWGQICIIDVLSRYARHSFPDPIQQNAELENVLGQNRPTLPVVDESGLSGLQVESTLQGQSGRTQSGLLHRHIDTQNSIDQDMISRLPTREELDSFYDSPSPARDTPEPSLGQAQHVVGFSRFGKPNTSSSDLSKGSSTPSSSLKQTNHSPFQFSGSRMAEGHKLLLRASIPLLHSRNSAVVLSVASLLWYCGKRSQNAMRKVSYALTRLVRSYREVQYAALNAILPLARERPSLFHEHIDSLFVNRNDASCIVLLKLDVLSLLATNENCERILDELAVLCSHPNKEVVTATIRAVGRIASALPLVADRCMDGLMMLVGSPHERVVAETVVVTRTLLQQHPQHPSMVERVVGMLNKTQVPAARASIIWIAARFLDSLPNQAADILRTLAGSFHEEAVQVKIQIVNLAIKLRLYFPKLAQFNSELSGIRDKVALLLQYILELSQYDVDYDLRSRSQFLAKLLRVEEGTSFSEPVQRQLERLFLCPKPSPVVEKVKSSIAVDAMARFNISSLSHLVGHAAFNYQPLPEWRVDIHSDQTKGTRENSAQDIQDSDFLGVSRRPRSISNSSGSSSSSSGSGSSSSGSGFDSSSDDSSSDNTSEEEEVERPGAPQATNILEIFDPHPSTSSTTDDLLSMSWNQSNSVGPGQPENSVLVASSDSSSSFKPIVRNLLSHVHGAGLQVDYWFSREESIYSKTMALVKMRLSNKKSISLNSIRIANIKVTSEQQLIPFPVISSLGPGATIEVGVHFDFGVEERSPISFQFVTDRGPSPVSIEVPLGEILRPPPAELISSINNFDSLRASLTGMTHQTAKIIVKSDSLAGQTLKAWVHEHITQTGNFQELQTTSELESRYVATLPGKSTSTHTPMLVYVEFPEPSPGSDLSFLLNVHCDEMMAGMTMMNSIKDSFK